MTYSASTSAVCEGVSERPILFSGPMVRAILDGRKTVTRRVVKYIPALGEPDQWCDRWGDPDFARIVGKEGRFCPYGAPGDRLWVRETLKVGPNERWIYAADGALFDPQPDDGTAIDWVCDRAEAGREYCPSIHMPRWASRITLEVTEVRVERLQEITREDAIAEGCPGWGAQDHTTMEWDCEYPEDQFRALWDSLNGKRDGGRYRWDANPWVWRIGFRCLGL